MQEISPETAVATIIRENYRYAEIFKRHNINFCCIGNMSLAEACALKGIDPTYILYQLTQVNSHISLGYGMNVRDWKFAFLREFFINLYHPHFTDKVPGLCADMITFALAHQRKFPELPRMVSTLSLLQEALSAEVYFDRASLFPYLEDFENLFPGHEQYTADFIRRETLSTKSNMLSIVALLTTLRSLSNNYMLPERACTNHYVVFGKLGELDDYLKQYSFLKNDILFGGVLVNNKPADFIN